jgi:hypothetical protein
MKLENLMKALFDIASNCGDFIIFLGHFFFQKKGIWDKEILYQNNLL